MSGLSDLIETIEGVIDTADSDHRGRMLERVTDLLMASAPALSTSQINAFDAVIGRLIGNAQPDARRDVAARISILPEPPPALIRRLACDPAGHVAAPVLSSRVAIPDAALMRLARTGSQDHLAAIAMRETLSERVTEAVAEKGEDEVLLTLLRNAGARFWEHALKVSTSRMVDQRALAHALASRRDLAPERREALLRDRPPSGKPPRRAVHNRPRAEARVKLRIRIGLEENDIVHWLANGRVTEALLALAHLADVPQDVAIDAHDADDPRTIISIVRIADLKAVTLAGFLSTRTPPCGATTLRNAITAFDRLTTVDAQAILRDGGRGIRRAAQG